MVRSQSNESTINLSSGLFVNYGNRMTALASIAETPRYRHYGHLIKDTYVREDYPDFNFNDDPDIYFTNRSIGLFEWDFTPIDDPYYEEEYELHSGLSLYMKRALREDVVGRVYHLQDNDWSEFMVTYNTRPDMIPYKEFVLPENYVGWLDIDLDDFLEEYNKHGHFNEGLAVVIETERPTYAWSREGDDSLAAELWHEYYQVRPNSGLRLLTSDITVERKEDRQIRVTLEIDSDFGEDRLEGWLAVPHFKGQRKFEANIIPAIAPPVPPRLMSGLEIPIFEGDDSFGLEMTVQRTDVGSLPSALDVPLFEDEDSMSATITARHDVERELQAVLDVPLLDDEKSFNADLVVEHILERKMQGDLEVPLFDAEAEISGDIVVRHDIEKELGSRVEVPLFEETKEITGATTVRHDQELQLESSIEVPIFDAVKELDSTTTIRHDAEREFKAWTEVPRYEDEARISGTVTVIGLSIVDIPVSLEVPVFEDTALLRDNVVAIIEQGVEEFDAAVDIPLFDTEDRLEMQVTAAAIGEDALSGRLRVFTDEVPTGYVFIM